MNKINIEKVIDYSNVLKENEKLKLEICTNENRYFEDIADEILKDNDKKEIVKILKRNFDLEDCLLNLKDLAEYQTKKLKQVLNGSDK